MNQDMMSSRQGFKKRAAATILGATSLLLAGTAMAQTQAHDDSNTVETEHGFFGNAVSYVKDNSYFRVGVLHLQYHGDSTDLKVENAKGLAAQGFGAGESRLSGTGSGAGNKTTLGGSIGLYVPKTGKHLAVEVMLAPPLKLDFQVTGKAANESLAEQTNSGIPTGIPPLGENIGSFKALPPNLTLVYRPWVDTMVQPYIGVGAMYMYTYDTDVNNKVLNAYGNEPTLNLDKPFACIGQLGFDVQLPNNMFVTADAKYIGCADVHAKLNNIKVNSPNLSGALGPIDVGTVSSTNKFEAMIYQLSLGMRF